MGELLVIFFHMSSLGSYFYVVTFLVFFSFPACLVSLREIDVVSYILHRILIFTLIYIRVFQAPLTLVIPKTNLSLFFVNELNVNSINYRLCSDKTKHFENVRMKTDSEKKS